MLDVPTIENALTFLTRCDLKGGEVPAFVQVTNALHAERIRLNEAAVLSALPAPQSPAPPAMPEALPLE